MNYFNQYHKNKQTPFDNGQKQKKTGNHWIRLCFT
ncbi:hypothetical protein LCGC14_0823970 [marine sediment metagenome]|uniref:Uncharacterized protein n=1 Tax=marine sediment metagenome TaxID=412755 RepID=A0A0F9SQI2_9ZZZZ